MKTLSKVLVLAMVIACEQAPIVESTIECSLDYEAALSQYQQDLASGDIDEQTPEPRECQEYEKITEQHLDVEIFMRDFNEEQEDKMLISVEKLKMAVNSVEFKERVLAHTYNGEKSFKKNLGLTNEEIYEKLMLGAEDLIPEVDYAMDVDVTLYYENSSTVGYTYRDTERTWINDKFFRNYTHAEVSKNVIHEWTHKLGFEHAFRNNSTRKYTVPYAIGSIIEELIEQM